MRGCRRLWALVQGLPPGSAVSRDGKAWLPEHEFAALAVERGDMWGALTARVFAGQKVTLPAPLTFSHPDRVSIDPESQPRRTSDMADVQRFFARIGR